MKRRKFSPEFSRGDSFGKIKSSSGGHQGPSNHSRNWYPPGEVHLFKKDRVA